MWVKYGLILERYKRIAVGSFAKAEKSLVPGVLSPAWAPFVGYVPARIVRRRWNSNIRFENALSLRQARGSMGQTRTKEGQ